MTKLTEGEWYFMYREGRKVDVKLCGTISDTEVALYVEQDDERIVMTISDALDQLTEV